MIQIDNVSKAYDKKLVVKDISFTVGDGEIVGFLGPNGAGKSTTMRIITGFIPPTSGSVTVAGIDVQKNPKQAKARIGYLPESAAVYQDMNVFNYLKFIGALHGLKKQKLQNRLQTVIQNCQLKSVLEKPLREVSKGFRQRVGIAAALIHDPAVLILDEPTVGLDPNQILEIRHLIRDAGKTKTILLSTHILQEVSAICDRMIILSEGRVVAEGTPASLSQKTFGKASYKIRVRAPQEKIREAYESIFPATTWNPQSFTDGIVEGILNTASEDDLSEKIFSITAEKGWRLSHLSRESTSLEDVFRKLTV